MATQLASQDPETLSFSSAVTAIDGDRVALEHTYFYAESGGQPADRGTIDGLDVIDVQLTNGTTWHTLGDEPTFDVDDVVDGQIDSAFRRYCLSAHTASHAVYGAARRLFDSVGYGGFEITPTKVRLDLETPVPIDDEALFELERRTNEVVWEDRPVTWSEWPASEVRENNEIALNVATEVVHTEETVRVVEIEDWDLAACGGTHVSSTAAIGSVAMIDRSNPGEGQTRVEFVVGEERIDQQHAEKTAAWRAKATLGVPIEDVPSRIDQLQEELQRLESRVSSMEHTVAAAEVTGSAATRFDRNGARWAVASVTEVDAKKAAEVAEDLVGEAGDIVVIAGGADRSHVVVAGDGSTPATDIVDAVLDGFDGGGGGGSDQKAQAGGIDAGPDAIVDRIVDVYRPR